MIVAAALVLGGLLFGTELIPNGTFESPIVKGKVPGWNIQGGQTVPGLVGNAVEFPVTRKTEQYFKTTLTCQLPALKSGKYLLSGAQRGKISALWIVLQPEGKQAATKAWLNTSKIGKPDTKGWRKFTVLVTISQDCKFAALGIEPFSSQTTKIALDEIRLMLVND